jgi:hypothetical protein
VQIIVFGSVFSRYDESDGVVTVAASYAGIDGTTNPDSPIVANSLRKNSEKKKVYDYSYLPLDKPVKVPYSCK